ncbi:MAG: FAD binding domain-containing protein [Eubacteriales bacterium]|nr:FAD binding domain-containing protein [Eubacteriales bacterium]
MHFQGLLRPKTALDAVALHLEYGDRAMYVAGATDILVAAREKELLSERVLIDLSGIDSLRYIRQGKERIHVGSLCTHADLASSEVIRRCAGVLAKGCLFVGSPQIRNLGTIGGNIGNASPAADTFGPLAMLRASVTLLGGNGERTLPLDQVIQGPYRTALTKEELITDVSFDNLEEYRQDFTKLGRRESLAISRLTVSAAVRFGADGRIGDLRVALGAAFPKPLLFEDVDALAIGEAPSANVAREVAVALSDKLPEIAGIRASTRYKQPVGRNLAQRLLEKLLEVSEE